MTTTRMATACRTAAVAGTLLLAGLAGAGAQGIEPKPIPPGFDFPADRATINGWVKANDIRAMRRHAWNVWAGMAADSGVVYQGKMLPIWETWYGDEEVFVTGLAKAAARTAPSRAFVRPRQFSHQGKLAADPDVQVVSFNKFNAASGDFLTTPHRTPPGSPVTYRYTRKASLDKLNASWSTQTPIFARKVDEFPNRAVDLKPVFMLVKQGMLTPVPYWSGPANSTNPAHPTPDTWHTCALVDPIFDAGAEGGELRPAKADEGKPVAPTKGLACDGDWRYATVNTFYYFKMSAGEAAAFNKAQGGQGGLSAAAGDYAILVAMHVTTKETVNWTWQTFWWGAGLTPPHNFPGYAYDAPAKVGYPWRYYAMCTAYSMVVPAGHPQGNPVICFNPYLETSPGIPDGVDSNCMSCHGTARYPASNSPFYPKTYKPNGFISFNDPAWFGGQTRTDFVWAVRVKAQ